MEMEKMDMGKKEIEKRGGKIIQTLIELEQWLENDPLSKEEIAKIRGEIHECWRALSFLLLDISPE